MRVIALLQPWASLVALGHKRIETRSWPTTYTGPVAIHASKGWTAANRLFAEEERALGRLPAQLPFGAIVAVATLIGCRFAQDVAPQISGLERRLGNYAPGRYAWMLADVQALAAPVPFKGALGLRPLMPGIEADVLEQLRRHA